MDKNSGKTIAYYKIRWSDQVRFLRIELEKHFVSIEQTGHNSRFHDDVDQCTNIRDFKSLNIMNQLTEIYILFDPIIEGHDADKEKEYVSAVSMFPNDL